MKTGGLRFSSRASPILSVPVTDPIGSSDRSHRFRHPIPLVPCSNPLVPVPCGLVVCRPVPRQMRLSRVPVSLYVAPPVCPPHTLPSILHTISRTGTKGIGSTCTRIFRIRARKRAPQSAMPSLPVLPLITQPASPGHVPDRASLPSSPWPCSFQDVGAAPDNAPYYTQDY